MAYKTLSILTLLAVTVLAGCNQDPTRRVPFEVPVVDWNDDGQYLPKRVGPGLVAREQSPIPDVPMPIGFKPVVSQCSSSFDGVARTVTHVYQGRSRTPETILFYRQQLPLQNWQVVDMQTHEDGSTSLHYMKGAETLGVRLSGRYNTATIEVFMSPR